MQEKVQKFTATLAGECIGQRWSQREARSSPERDGTSLEEMTWCIRWWQLLSLTQVTPNAGSFSCILTPSTQRCTNKGQRHMTPLQPCKRKQKYKNGNWIMEPGNTAGNWTRKVLCLFPVRYYQSVYLSVSMRSQVAGYETTYERLR